MGAWGDSEKIEQALIKPATDGSSMSTLDGSQTFSQPVSCLSSSSFLEMFFAPGAGGDIAPLSVSQDLDLNGTLDTTQTLPAPVSGVCANGVITCDAGTWNACQGYSWGTASDTDPTLTIVPTSPSELQGCFCVNDSCGTGLVAMNEAEIGNNLAGGMAAALNAYDPAYAVAQVGQTPFQVTLAAQSSTSCTGQGVTQVAYGGDPAAMVADGAAAAPANTLYAFLEGSPMGGGGNVTADRTCQIERRLVAYGDVADAVSVSGSSELTTTRISPNEMVIEVGRLDERNWLTESCSTGHIENVVIRIADPATLQSVVIERAQIDDWSQVHIDGEGGFIWSYPAGFSNFSGGSPDCERSRDNDVAVNRDVTSYFSDGEAHTLRLRTIVGGTGQHYLRIRVRTRCTPRLDIVDGCAANTADDQCRLTDETVDGVSTYEDGVSTGLFPLSSTQTAGTGACSVTATEPWWLRDRTYECVTAGPDGVTPPNMDRATHIYENVTPTGYSDLLTGPDGSPLTGTFDTSAFEITGDCELTCKVRLETQETSVGATGPVVGERIGGNNTQVVHQFRTCTPAGACPIEAGEVLETDCACQASFPEALVAMQAVRLAGKDMTCTTGVQQPW